MGTMLQIRPRTTVVIAGLSILLGAGAASAATVERYLKAGPASVAGAPGVPMWGFAECDSTFTCGPTTVPGPRINAVAGDTVIIHLLNTLTVPTSVVVPGQRGGGLGSPVPLAGNRTQSFGPEAAAATGTAVYTWSAVKAGTYLYQSGTLPSVQVPMGLYGALVVTDSGGGPYAGVAPTADEELLLFSEVDPVQNAAVDAAGAVIGDYPSTVNYNAAFFLINGASYPSAALNLAVGSGGRVLLRLLNTGLRSHIPAIVGLDMTLIAEDGNRYPTNRTQSQALLPAGKTLDAIVALPTTARSWPLYDRLLALTNDGQPGGGMLAYLVVGAGSPPEGPPPTGTADSYTTAEDTRLTAAAPGVLANDGGATNARLVGSAEHGQVSLRANGSFAYTPDTDYAGPDGFSYVAAIGGSDSQPIPVTINVGFVNDAPVARDDAYTNQFGASVTGNVLENDGDADGDALTVVNVRGSCTIAADGSFSYGGASTSCRYQARDGSGALSAPVSVTLTMLAVRGLTVTVLGPPLAPGGTPVRVENYRWVVEEDRTFHPNPQRILDPENGLATTFHRSYMPVVAQGRTSDASLPTISQLALDPAKHYFVSVLPDDAGTGVGHAMGGSPVPPGATAVTVHVTAQPLPTAQMSVYVFEDNNPTNGVYEGPEPGLGGWQILLEEAGGRYGHNGGLVSQDAYGNPVRNSKDCGPGGTAPQAGVILTCPDGTALIKDLSPGKYGIQVIPPAGSPVRWSQTSTIEGTKTNDAWVKANEPPYFQEFGPPGPHVFMGFVREHKASGGSNTVRGRATLMRLTIPPNQTLVDSDSTNALVHTTCWAGLNADAGIGENIAAVKCGEDGNFTIENVPNGTYQLVLWDAYLDTIIAFRSVTVPDDLVDHDESASTPPSLGNIPVFTWFARHEHNVFLDIDEDGVRDPGEPGLPEQAINLRFRDGSIYQSFPTDRSGFVPFDEVFPFFHWLIAEVDYTRFKPTGATVTVDGGGMPNADGILSPRVVRTDTGPFPFLLEGFQAFIGQTHQFDWGKAPYKVGENGGIAGIVFNTVTRAENDPRLAAAEGWEPGIPRSTVRLYRETNTAPAAPGGAPAKAYTLVDEVQTDSWDDSLPTDCEPSPDASDPFNRYDCFDGLRNFGQIRPAVFDGGYAFTDIPPGNYIVEVVPPPGYQVMKAQDKNVDFGNAYDAAPVDIVLPTLAAVITVPDQAFVAAAMGPQPGVLQPACVGEEYTVPAELSLFPGVEAPFAGSTQYLCNRKAVTLNDQDQRGADFHLMTETPIAAHAVGFILDDLSNEFNPESPQFGEKWAPPFVPISVRDWTGREIQRVYSDQWGHYNLLVPSTFSINVPEPSGVSPNIVTTCMNDPGPIPGPGGVMITDPQYNPQYSNFCYNFQYMPGTTTYLDTPVMPTAAFAAGDNPVDCALPNQTPVIREVYRVSSGPGSGPFVTNAGANNLANNTARQLRIVAMGPTDVPNPAYIAPNPLTGNPGPNPKTVPRDYGFGATAGTVMLDIIPSPLPNCDPPGPGTNWNTPCVVAWSADAITIQWGGGGGANQTAQLSVTRSNGRSSVTSITVTRGNEGDVRRVPPGGSIQRTIDAAPVGSLVLVPPGSYDELVVLWKRLRLQGSGAGSTIINAAKRPTEKLVAWRQKLEQLFDGNNNNPGPGADCDLLPGQTAEAADAGFAGIEPGLLIDAEGAAITVCSPQNGPGSFGAGNGNLNNVARIDGFTITGGDQGGGIFVNGWAHRLRISNNRIVGNSGVHAGGVRVGDPDLVGVGFNTNLVVRNNAITHNGLTSGTSAGGGLGLFAGCNNYTVDGNWICGNFSTGDGGGIGHLGLSPGSTISNNSILFNQSFNQGLNRSGGGVFIAGVPGAAGALSPGAGSVNVTGNLIQGNHAGAGHGGGIRLQNFNGEDVTRSPNNPNPNGTQNDWYQATIANNIIVNNVAGWSGAGISLQDTALSSIMRNTIANNDSTATVGVLFDNPNTSTPETAGLTSEPHSAELNAAIGTGLAQYRNFSNPILVNDIIWHNRSFTYNAAATPHLQPLLPATTNYSCPSGAVYRDLGVLGGAFQLNPLSSTLTSTAGYDASNNSTPPSFNGTPSEYCNGPRALGQVLDFTTLPAIPALDEGGNYIDVRYGPISLTGSYTLPLP